MLGLVEHFIFSMIIRELVMKNRNISKAPRSQNRICKIYSWILNIMKLINGNLIAKKFFINYDALSEYK